jgi:cruciform cutting endonuclease 1
VPFTFVFLCSEDTESETCGHEFVSVIQIGALTRSWRIVLFGQHEKAYPQPSTNMSKVDPSTVLSSLKAWQLKHLAFLTGLNSTGTKASLCRTLVDRTNKPGLSASPCRILSVDMGVKNLAFCLLETRRLQVGDQTTDRTLSLHLSDWKRLDVSERLVANTNTTKAVTSQTSAGSTDEAGGTTEIASADQSNIYAPSSLSKIAVGLASEFLQYKPDYILIERQRFRSGGGPAIQEWTVRVNMLESMIWASLETMRHGHSKEQKFPEVLEMSPRRVGMFWLTCGIFFPTPANIATSLEAPQDTIKTMEAEVKKKSFEKKDKIALARHWLSVSMITDDLTVDENIAPMVASFCSPKGRQSRRRNKDGEQEEQLEVKDAPAISGKLDDLADCLVQAVTFTLWEQNREGVREYVKAQV